MNDTITQTRLSMRLDMYMSDYTKKKSMETDEQSQAEWNTVWKAADRARIQNTLTPELVDDVRRALQKL
jgi:hypothetical protein